jgi:CelD/BcsL family acetyltransferase involved in cellulose biosynthesis
MPPKSEETEQKSLTGFRVRVATELADFAELWPRTDRLQGVHCYPFQCADVLQVWCETVGKARNVRTFFVAVFDDKGAPVFLLPLGIERYQGIKTLRFLDGGIADYNAPVLFEPLRDWRRETIHEIWRDIVRALPRFEIAMLDKMPAEVEGAPNPLINLECVPAEQSAHSLSLSGTWSAYAANGLPHRRNSTYQRRRLSKLGKLTFRIAETQEDRHAIVQDILRQKSARFVDTTGVDHFNKPGYAEYFELATDRFPWPGSVFIAALELDSKVLAAGWHFVIQRRFFYLIPSFEGGSWRSYSPGRLLLEDLIEWSYSRGITVFDFTIGDEAYKFDYTNQILPLFGATIPATAIGNAYDGIRKLTKKIVKRIANARRKTV